MFMIHFLRRRLSVVQYSTFVGSKTALKSSGLWPLNHLIGSMDNAIWNDVYSNGVFYGWNLMRTVMYSSCIGHHDLRR